MYMYMFIGVSFWFVRLSLSLYLSFYLTSLLLPSSHSYFIPCPRPFDPNPFNDSIPSSPLKSVRKARASLCFFHVVQTVQ